MDQDQSFKFVYLNKKLPVFSNKDLAPFFEKWCLKHTLKFSTFTYNKQFNQNLINNFVQEFFTSDTVSQIIDLSNTTPVETYEAEEVPCTYTSMSLFNRLKDEGIVRESGSICKCMDELVDGIYLSDELRKMILMEDSDNFECYNDGERAEFLFRVFSHLVLGGSVCQYEDFIKPYIDVTKALYKDLICVQKFKDSEKLNIVTKIYKITGKDHTGYQVYPSENDHPQTFAYLLVDPLKRHVSLLSHNWGRSSVW